MLIQLKTWLRRTNLEVPAPMAGAILFATLVCGAVAILIDWSTVGLPPPGAPGRHDWATEKYYKQYRMQLEAERKEFLKQNPGLRQYPPLPTDSAIERLRRHQEKRD